MAFPPLTSDSADLDFHGLQRPPFSGTLDRTALYAGETFARAHRDLLQALRRGEPLTVMSGPSGVGKTVLWRAVMKALRPRLFSAILNPRATEIDVVRQIARDVGAVTKEAVANGVIAQWSTHELVLAIHDMIALAGRNARALLVVIDDAHRMPVEVLEQLRTLLNLDAEGMGVQALLVGDTEIETVLADPAARSIRERVTHWCRLEPLGADEVGAYIAHRMAAAGRSDGTIFDVSALGEVAEISSGLPRRIGQICTAALARAFDERTPEISASLVRDAAGVPEKTPASSPVRRVAVWTVAAVAVVAAGFAWALASNRGFGTDNLAMVAATDRVVTPAPPPASAATAPPPAVATPPMPAAHASRSETPSGPERPVPAAAVPAPPRVAVATTDDEVLRVGKTLANKADVRGLLLLQEQVKKRLGSDAGDDAPVLGELEKLLEEAQLLRLKLDNELLRRPPSR